MIDRTQIPLNTKRTNISIPKYNINFLANNAPCYFIHDDSQPLVSFKLLFKTGAYHEKKNGTANLTTQLLTLGNSKYNAEQIAETTDYYGANFYSNSIWDESTMGFVCLSDFFKPIFDLFINCIFDSIFDNEELDRLIKKQTASIQHQNSDPNYITQITFNNYLFQGLPYQKPRIGRIDDLKLINRQDCIDFRSELLDSEFSIIISGNFKESEVLSSIESQFSNLKNSINPDKNQFFNENISKSTLVKIIKKDAKQITYRIGKKSICRDNPDFSSLMTLNTMFGGYFLSRLNSNLREVKGYTYGINSFIDSRRHSSAFVIGTSLNEDSGLEAIKDIFFEMDKFQNQIISDEELNRSINFMLGSFARGMETPLQISQLIQTLSAYDLPGNYFEKFYETILNFTPENLLPKQNLFFKQDKLLIIACGSDEKLQPLDTHLIEKDYQIISLEYENIY